MAMPGEPDFKRLDFAADTHTKPLTFYDEYGLYGSAAYERMEKVDSRSMYREATDQEQADRTRCYDCRFYQWGTCNLVEGTVEANYVCNLFKAQPELYPVSLYSLTGKNTHTLDFFIERRDFESTALPEWIDYFPRPGRFNHYAYGELVITEDVNKQIVENFKSGKYTNAQLPVDCEHNLAGSGAVGFITDMRISDTGSIEAKVEWNETGKTLIEGGRFRYFSPSFFQVWPDTVTGELIPNVAVGGAITNTPYFTESWLRPLVATADGALQTYERASKAREDGVREVRIVELVAAKPQEASTVDEEEKKAEAQKQAAPVAEKVTITPITMNAGDIAAWQKFQAEGGLAMFSTLKSQVDEQQQTILGLQQSNREQRFTALARGLEIFEDGTSKQGKPWAGDLKFHLGQMALIANTKGEDSDEFKQYLTHQRAIAEQVNTKMFTVLGDDLPKDDLSATEEFTNLVNSIKADNKEFSHSQAIEAASKKNPDLFRAYRIESTERV